MKRIIIIVMVTLLGVVKAQALATNEVAGRKNVIHDLDNRFRCGTMVLKFQDENDNRHVFLREED